MTRHYGMDWLRIGAFGILILYHIGMVFVPWNFHVNAPEVERWAILPMLAVNAWRLTLLFVVSGYASRALLAKSHGPRGFLANRSWRLLVPLAFGIAVVVPPQAWVELVSKYGYSRSYLAFWATDYLSFGRVAGIVLPAWNHLWFVLYLWIYTAALSLLLMIARASRLQHAFDWFFGRWTVLVVPLAWLIAIHAWWFPMVGETHALVGDTMAHLEYLPALLFGFALFRSPPAMAAIIRWHRVAGVIALLGLAWIEAAELRLTPIGMNWLRLYGAAHACQQWGAILALIGFAERHWNRDHPIRATLTEAVFPFYLIHQTIIVVVTWWLRGAGLGGAGDFAALAIATVAGCWAFYLIGRRIPPLRPLIGLRWHARPHRA